MIPIPDGRNDVPAPPGPPARKAKEDMDDIPSGAARDNAKGGGGMGTGAIIGIVVGVLLLCCCFSCGGCTIFQWDEFKKQFDIEMKKQQQKK